MSEYTDKIRQMFGEGDKARDAGLTTPWDVVRYDNIQYGEDPQWQIMDLYRPRNAGEKELPVIISFHGGGWVYGDKEVYQFYCMSLAQMGFAVVNFTYRLAPEFQFPAPLEDMNLVVNWVLDHAGEYHLDTRHVFGVGDSAGGHGLGLYAAFTANPEYADQLPFDPPKDFAFSAVALNCAALDMGEGDQPLKEAYLPAGTREDLVTVIPWINEAFPPTYVMTANQDFLKANGPKMAAALMEHEIPVVMACYGTKEEPQPHVFHCNVRNPEGNLCNREEVAFFRRYL